MFSFTEFKYLPERLCLYGDKGVGKSHTLKSNYESWPEKGKAVYLEDIRPIVNGVVGVEKLKYLFLDHFDNQVFNLDVPYIFTTNVEPLQEDFFNYPIYSKTSSYLLNNFPGYEDCVHFSLGSIGNLVDVDPDFKDFWKGFCRIIFNYNPHTLANSLSYVSGLEVDYYYSWLIFLKLIIDKNNSNPIVVMRLKSFSTYLHKVKDRMGRDEFWDTFVNGVYGIYNNRAEFPAKDKIINLLNCVDYNR